MGIDVTRIENGSGLSRRALTLAGVALVALALAGCGKRGPLEPPPADKEAKEAKPQSGQGAPVGVPGGFKGGTKRPAPIRPPKEPFILDPLLD